ncbi:MAG: hypothetical protein G01um101413_516 [Parcubacteria group bacterium Gr01-1014_13]|nr:MAG: hypothetical protein G01um101413_516 [Parcubacteria group bacterium Gr01-1014_13]
MSNSEETCQNIKSLKEHKIQSLCKSCRNELGCAYHMASDLIGEFKTPGVRQEHIIKTCFSYQKLRIFSHRGEEFDPTKPTIGNLQPQLFNAEVKDLCACCPSEMKGDCTRHRHLNDLANTSYMAGTWVEGQVVCCNQSERLYQISEPKRSP